MAMAERSDRTSKRRTLAPALSPTAKGAGAFILSAACVSVERNSRRRSAEGASRALRGA
jgi:hypothetical protein